MIKIMQDYASFSQINAEFVSATGKVEVYVDNGNVELTVDVADTYVTIDISMDDLLELVKIAMKSKVKEEFFKKK